MYFSVYVPSSPQAAQTHNSSDIRRPSCISGCSKARNTADERMNGVESKLPSVTIRSNSISRYQIWRCSPGAPAFLLLNGQAESAYLPIEDVQNSCISSHLCPVRNARRTPLHDRTAVCYAGLHVYSKLESTSKSIVLLSERLKTQILCSCVRISGSESSN